MHKSKAGRGVAAAAIVAMIGGVALAGGDKVKRGTGKNHETGGGKTISITWQPAGVSSDMARETEDYTVALLKWKQDGQKGPEPKPHFFTAQLTIDQDGSWTYTGKVDGTPCTPDATSCSGVIELNLKSDKGTYVYFGDSHNKVTSAGYAWSKQGKNKMLADHFDDFAKGHWSGGWKFHEVEQSDFAKDFDDVAKVVGTVLKVATTAISIAAAA